MPPYDIEIKKVPAMRVACLWAKGPTPTSKTPAASSPAGPSSMGASLRAQSGRSTSGGAKRCHRRSR